ncbi:hypothetical protein [Faecalibacter bovis]|uniref:Ricin B lectin domain-containing protein n=1 Tax=Faecalibacter bovis TaxID=2898187 RepID=A0ABX7XBK7_9FLAO|nr:hypothetical protein [Faecalibacter bovis]QTV05255.1 hypothetical protein J9309_10780 [Faecalibacter bovis]
MIKNLLILLPLTLFYNCKNQSQNTEIIKEDSVELVDLSTISEEKKQLVKEIIQFQKDLEERKTDRVAEYLDSPKRVEEIELSMQNSKIRNAIESNSSRLSTDVIRDQFDLLYTEMDLNIINDAIKSISENDLLTQDKASTKVSYENCNYDVDVSMNGKEVKFNIQSENETDECKNNQQWKFMSNGEFLVLDRRYYL